jgi:hypothetical protein
MANPDCLISKCFTVGEVTQNDLERILSPGSVEEISSHLRLTLTLFALPGTVRSTLRPGIAPTISNLAVGGVSNSQHITGAAADIYPIGSSEYEFEEWLLPTDTL